MPPYNLPKMLKVVNGLKSNTHKGKGYNEMSMIYTAGKEKIVTHAQFDMNTSVGTSWGLKTHVGHQKITVDRPHAQCG